MFQHLGPFEALRIDRFVNRLCRNPAAYGELNQLHRLFTQPFRRALEMLLNRSLQQDGRPAVCDVRLGWIDKIPIARSASLTRGTELGDAVVFAIDERRDLTGNRLTATAQAVILQAKVARLTSQLSAPSVPIGTGKSSQNELTLLSSWPPFDLHDTSGSRSPCLTNVMVGPTAIPSREAWFIAAPGHALSPLTRPSWPSWWMAGEARGSANCTTTIGDLIVNFLAPSPSAPPVGAPFILRPTPLPGGGAATPANWSDLCNEILRILGLYSAPPSLFGTSQPRVYSVPTWAQLFTCVAASDQAWVTDAASGRLRPHHRYDPPFGYSSFPDWHGEGRKFFVVTVTITRFGGD